MSHITVQTHIEAPIEKIWEYWTKPDHITKWCTASPDWHTPHATNDLRTGGTFITRMESKDGAHGFDFGGTYTDVQPYQKIAYTMGDGRIVEISFEKQDAGYQITETFDVETQNSVEKQQEGWQAILNNFKEYVTNH